MTTWTYNLNLTEENMNYWLDVISFFMSEYVMLQPGLGSNMYLYIEFFLFVIENHKRACI